MADDRAKDRDNVYNVNLAIAVLLGIVFLPIVAIHLIALLIQHS